MMAKKNVKMHKDVFRVRLAVLIILLIGVLIYFLVFQGELENRSNLVGDRICSSYSDSVDRNNCCAEIHKNDAAVACVGEWTFNQGGGMCEFNCVSDDNNLQIQACESSEGEWRTFNNGCVDSCALERNPELILCTQALTDGCDCGIDKCWNGESCEDN